MEDRREQKTKPKYIAKTIRFNPLIERRVAAFAEDNCLSGSHMSFTGAVNELLRQALNRTDRRKARQ
jgi:hypothetical protein